MAQMLDLADLVGGESKAAITNTFKEPNESNLSFFFPGQIMQHLGS